MTHIKSAPRSSRATIPIGIFTAAITMGACNPNQPPASPPPPSLAQTAPQRYGATMMQPRDEGPGRAPPAGVERAPVSEAQLATLDDEHLAGLIQELNDGAIRIAGVGERRVTDAEVKRFARDVATTDLAAQNRLSARLSELGIDTASGPVSEQVRADVGGDLESLPTARGKDFDRAYVDGQLRDLSRAAELCGRVVGHVKSPELRKVLEGLHARLDADVRLAQSLREAVRNGTTDQRPDAYNPDKMQR